MTCRIILSVGVAATLLAGCADPKAASKANFQAALQKWFDAHPECISLGRESLKFRADDFTWRRKLPDALTKAGLLTREEGTETGRGWGNVPNTYKVVRYRPTAKAGDAIRDGEDRFLGGTDLCFAHRKVEDVISYTEPGELMGRRISQLSYRYRLEGVAPWAGDPALRVVLPVLGQRIAQPAGEDKALLVLTDDGWTDQRGVTR